MRGIFKCLHFESEDLGGRDRAFVGSFFFSSSRLIIYSKLLTSCMLLVSFRPRLLFVGLITADRFNWLSCGTIILYTGKRPLIRFKQNVSP